MKRIFLVLLLFLLSNTSLYASPFTEQIAALQVIYDQGNLILANPSLYPHFQMADLSLISSVVSQAGVLLDTFYIGFSGFEQPTNPSFNNWVIGALYDFFDAGGLATQFENLMNSYPLLGGDVVIPVSIPDLDYAGVVMNILGYLSGIAALAVGLGLSVWGVPFLFRFFKGMAR